MQLQKVVRVPFGRRASGQSCPTNPLPSAALEPILHVQIQWQREVQGGGDVEVWSSVQLCIVGLVRLKLGL